MLANTMHETADDRIEPDKATLRTLGRPMQTMSTQDTAPAPTIAQDCSIAGQGISGSKLGKRQRSANANTSHAVLANSMADNATRDTLHRRLSAVVDMPHVARPLPARLTIMATTSCAAPSPRNDPGESIRSGPLNWHPL